MKWLLSKAGWTAIPSSPPPKTFAVLNVANGSSSNTQDSITLTCPAISVTKILSPAKSIAQGFSKLVAKICTYSLPYSVVGSGIDRGLKDQIQLPDGGFSGATHIAIAKIIAPTIPAILIRLSIIKLLQIVIIITSLDKGVYNV